MMPESNSSSVEVEGIVRDGRQRPRPRHGGIESPTQRMGTFEGSGRHGRNPSNYAPESNAGGFRNVSVGDVLRRWRAVVFCGIVALLVSITYFVIVGPHFTSRASLLLAPSNPSDTSGQGIRADLETESRVAMSEPVLTAAAQAVGTNFKEMEASAEATPVTNTRILQLSVEGTAPDESSRRMQAIIDAYRRERVSAQATAINQYREYIAQELAKIEEARDASRPIAGTQTALDAQRSQLLTDLSVVEGAARTETGGVSVVDPPGTPTEASFYVSALLQVLLSGTVGLVVGVVTVAIRLATSRRVETSRQFTDLTSIPVLGCVDRDAVKGLHAGSKPDSLVNLSADSFPSVRRALAVAGSRTHALCSIANTKAGRISALSLAAAAAGRGSRVLLVSAEDFPEVDEVFAEPHEKGAGTGNDGEGGSAATASSTRVTLTPAHTGIMNLWYLSKREGDDAVAMLTSPGVRRAIAESSRQWGECFVMCTGEDLALLGESIGAVVLLVSLGEVDESSLRQLISRYSGSAIVGAILIEQ
jgi:capsular polysaccharide biosynthesis protein